MSGYAGSSYDPTNRANDAGTTMILLGLVVNVEIALPFQLGAVGKMVESVTHLVCLSRLCSGFVV